MWYILYISVYINIDKYILHAFLFINIPSPHTLILRRRCTSISESKRMLWSHECRKALRTVLKLMTSTGKTTRAAELTVWTGHGFGDFGGDFWMGQNGRMTYSGHKKRCFFGAQSCWSPCDILEMISSPKKKLPTNFLTQQGIASNLTRGLRSHKIFFLAIVCRKFFFLGGAVWRCSTMIFSCAFNIVSKRLSKIRWHKVVAPDPIRHPKKKHQLKLKSQVAVVSPVDRMYCKWIKALNHSEDWAKAFSKALLQITSTNMMTQPVAFTKPKNQNQETVPWHRFLGGNKKLGSYPPGN